MDNPSFYIPIDRRQALAQRVRLPDRSEGTALFADLSGFTALTEALATELGPKRGAEALTLHLNAIFSALIAEVDRYHGSVITFAGDAITCWFDQDDGRRAVACALNMQAAMRPFGTITTPSGTAIELAIKVALTAGPVRRLQVGDPAIHFVDVLAGETLMRLSAAEHETAKGEVAVSPETAAQLREAVQWGERRPAAVVVRALAQPVLPVPWPTGALDELAEAEVKPWLLPALYERLQTRSAQFLAEIRPAVSLFLRFEGIDYDRDEGAQARLDQFIRWVQRILQRYEGSLLQLSIGDKGSYLYGAFGAPVAHDDDAARAAAAALELQTPPAELAFITSLQIGISQGRAWAGPYGGPTRRTYGVIGDEVNVSARLMSRAAAGQILISDRVARALGDAFRLEPLGPLQVKGKQAAISVSALHDRAAPAARSSLRLFEHPLVGRTAELAQLAEALEAALAGRGQVVRLAGSAGVGKSHLAAVVLAQAAARQAQIALGVSQSTTAGLAYGPWRQIFTVLLGLDSAAGADPAAALQAFITAANPDWQVRLPLLGDLLGLPIPDNATTAAFEPRLRQSALLSLATDILHYLARRQPLVILLDDAHWMDEASRTLTVAAARALADAPILLLLVQRPPVASAEVIPELDPLAHTRRLNLDELTEAGVAGLIHNKLGGPPGLLALSLIMAETQGNPFFVEELLDSLKEANQLYLRPNGEWALADSLFQALQRANALARSPEGHWRLAPNVSLSAIDLGLPDSIQGVVLARIDRLPRPHQVTLKVASVVGQTFGLDLIERSHPDQPGSDQLVEQVGLLEDRDFTRPEAAAREQYAFKHTVTRDVAYDTLLQDQRRQLHRAVGRALEQIAPEAAGPLAHHLFVGEDWERALRYQMAAGQQAQRLFANHEGLEHFRKALHCAERLPAEDTRLQRQMIHSTLGELLATIGQYEPALEHLQQALALAQDLESADAQARACRWTAYVHEFRGEYAAALDWIRQGLAALGGRQTAFTAELQTIAALIHIRQGQFDQAVELCAASMALATDLGETTSLAFAHNARALVAYTRGQTNEAISQYQRAAELYQQADNIQGQAMSYNGIGNAYFNVARWTEANNYLQKAREIFIRTGDEYHRVFADNNLGETARYQGRLDDALRFYGEALQTLEKSGGSRYVIGVLHMNLGATHLRRRAAAEARRHLTLSQACFEQVNSRDFLAELYGYWAEENLLEADVPAAEAHARQALSLARELQMRVEEGTSLRVLGESARRRGDLAEAERCLRESARLLAELGHSYGAARSQLAAADLYVEAGRPADAAGLLAECLPVFERLEAHLDLAMGRAVQARLPR